MSAPRLRLATGPVTWGVDFADTPGNPPWERVLDEIGQSGLGAMELGPVGYLPEDPEPLRAALAERRVEVVGGCLFEDLHDPEAREAVLSVSARCCDALEAADAGLFVIIDRPGPERVATAGRSEDAPRMSPARWEEMLGLIVELAAGAAERGLRPVVHPHAGGWIEFDDEVDRLLADTDLELCLDVGHAAYSGLDTASAFERWGERIGYVHLKDVDPRVLARVRTEKLDFWEAIAAGIFCPLGDGVVDFDVAAERLTAIGYAGFATIEQDRVPGGGRPLVDLGRSVEALRRAGFGTGGADG